MVTDKDMGWEKIKRELKKAHKSSVNIGYIKGKSADLNILKAIVNEYGSKKNKIRPRPFNRYTFSKFMTDVVKFQSKLYGQILDGKQTTYPALRKIGLFYKALIQLSIRTGPWLENASSTRRRKKSTKPLIDSGEMMRDVQFKVIK